MRCISALVILVCVAARAYAQDQRVCYQPTTVGIPLPTLEGNAFSAGYEKKQKSVAVDQYSFVESGLQTYSTGTKTIPAREVMKVLRPTSSYKHLVDYATNQVLVMNLADAWADDGCIAQNLGDYAKLEDSVTQMMGFDVMRKPMMGPFSVFFLNLTVTPISDDLYHNDMVTNEYTSCYYDPASQLTVAFFWWYLASSGMPSSAMVQYAIAGGPVKQIAYDFFNFQSFEVAGVYPFEIPPFYMCTTWLHNKPALFLNKTIAFDSEVLMKSDNPTDPNIILSFSDQMDVQFNVSRRTSTSGQMDGSVTTTTTVFDGTSGIRYVIDDRLGNCSMSVATIDNTDVLWAHMISPADFWQNKGTQAYGGIKLWRGLTCETVVMEVMDSVYRVKVRYEIYIALSNELIHLPVDQMPVAQLIGVPPNFQPRITTYQNIFNYDINTATIADYDVSACYVLESQRHLVMSFPANPSIVETFPDLVRDSFIRAVASLTKLSPVRVANVQVESTDKLHITFTVFHTTHIPGALPQQSTTKSVNALFDSVANGRFTVKVRYMTDQEIVLTANEMHEISRRTPMNWFRGFSGGDLAAVMLCMFFGTLIITIVLFYFLVAPYYFKPVVGGGGTEVNIQ